MSPAEDIQMRETASVGGLEDPDDEIDGLNTLEAKYYDQGYSAGFAHGRLHGLFEGRALGQEKCYELWEELGFVQGVAELWREVAHRQAAGEALGKKVSSRALTHIETLLTLINAFPTYNPTPAPAEPANIDANTTLDSTSVPPLAEAEPEVDLAASLERIRARYRLLCSSLGIRPRLATSQRPEEDAEDGGQAATSGVVQGIEGPMKGVDTKLLRF